MRLGYACLNVTLGRKMRGLRLKTLRERGIAYLQSLVDENLALTADILRWNRAHDIDMFRLSSDIVPFGSHEDVDLALLDFSLARDIPSLAEGMRLSLHPGQFTVISSAGAVWDNSYRELVYHNSLLDILGVDGDIVVHGGGVYGDREGTARRIVENIALLPKEIRLRLRLENDERAWAVRDLLPICEEAGLPLIVDNLHHALNGAEPLADLPWARIGATWGGRLPKAHYSEQDPTKQPGAHSAYVTAGEFQRFRGDIGLEDVDVMLECKAKEQALLRLRADLTGMADAPGQRTITATAATVGDVVLDETGR